MRRSSSQLAEEIITLRNGIDRVMDAVRETSDVSSITYMLDARDSLHSALNLIKARIQNEASKCSSDGGLSA